MTAVTVVMCGLVATLATGVTVVAWRDADTSTRVTRRTVLALGVAAVAGTVAFTATVLAFTTAYGG